MLTLNDGRSELWQWDTGRKLTVDADCTQVHFSNKVFGRSVDVDVVDGVAIIPDVLLQTDKELTAWAFVGTVENGYTKISKVFKVNKRNKPADYVFTPTDQTSLEELIERLDEIEESQDPDAIKNAVEDYLEKNPVEAPVQSVNGYTGKVELTAEDVGAISQDDLQEATNEALAQAKASGEFKGDPGTPGKDGSNGVSATHSWNGTVLSITSASGTSSADLKGEKGDKGDKGDSIKGDKGDKGDTGATGSAGSPGADGVSPTVSVSKSGKVTTISIVDKNGTKTATINDGADGSSGSNGKDGTSVTVKSVSESTADGGSNVVTFSDGKTLNVKNGSKGDTGAAAIFTMFISPDGSDSNDGLTASKPKKTVKACVEAGATQISAKRGVYNEAINLQNIGSLEISPTDNEKTYVVKESRQPIIFDTSDVLNVSSVTAYNSIKRIAYSNAANVAYNKVFVEKTLAPTVSTSQSSYHAAVWLFSDDEKTVCHKPKPVLTIAECEAEANTFCYSGGYIYINANMTGVTKIVVPTITDNGFYVNGANNLVLREVEVRFSGEYSFDLRNCSFVDLYKCASKYTARASGFHPVNTNGVFRACYATKCFDGFAPNGHGHTTYIDCVSEYNFDDGMSHHSGTEGTVIGGRYEGNGKGGNTPAYGAKVNIYGGLYKDNAQWGVGYVGSASDGYVSGMVQGAVMADNPVGLVVQANCDVIAMNCTYQGNTSDKDVSGNLTEYNANYVKTVNGVAPDADGNVNVEASGGDTGPTYTNVLKSAIDTDGSVFNETGYKNGYRLNSSATEKEQATSGYTGFIKITPGQSNTIRMKNLELCSDGHHYVHGFDASFARKDTALQNAAINTKDENGVVTFEVYANWEYIRISTGLMNAETIITINEEITD